eukprot:scaffold143068_cov29-Attheya_sp.AAC.1
MIGPRKKKIAADDFYVRPSIVWIPHLIIDGYLPQCPNCNSGQHVDLSKWYWVDFPKICYGRSGHRYLDTIRYPCTKCGITFRGTDQTSMKLDKTGDVRNKFRFYIGKSSAIDEELFFDIVKRPLQPTTQVFHHLRSVIMQKFVMDVIEFLHDVGRDNVVDTHRENTLDRHLVRQSSSGQSQSGAYKVGRMQLLGRVGAAERSLLPDRFDDFEALKASKEKKKGHKLAGLGPAMLDKLLTSSISSGRELVGLFKTKPNSSINKLKSALAGNDSKRESIIRRWVESIEKERVIRENKLKEAKEDLSKFDREQQEEDTAVPSPVAASTVNGATNNTTVSLPKFSRFLDRSGYNARFLSAHLIDHVRNSYFLHRKPLMKLKMLRRTGQVLKLDFQYGIPGRVHVYKKGVGWYKPWKSWCTIMNEHNQVIWWAFLQNSESITEIEEQLIELNKRIVSLGHEVLVIYGDKCCSFRKKLQKIFPNAVVCQDSFHWMQRWNELFRDPKSEEAMVCRECLRRAINVVSDAEYKQKEVMLFNKLKRKPTPKEVLQQCNTSSPDPDKCKTTIKAIIAAFEQRDTMMMILAADIEDDAERRKIKTTFKPGNVVRDRLGEQLKHVGCLFPPADVVMLYKGAKDKMQTVSCLLGLNRADECLWTFYDNRDERQNIVRRNSTDHYSATLESLAFANSVGTHVRYDTIFSLSIATGSSDEIRLFRVGLELLPKESTTDANDSGDAINNANNEATVDDDVQKVEEFEEEDDDDDVELCQHGAVDKVNELHTFFDEVLNRTIEQRGTSFERLTAFMGGNPSVPFNHDATDDDKTSKEELRLFREMSTKYKRHVSPSSTGGYVFFQNEWNELAGHRQCEHLLDLNVTPIYSKNVLMLQNYHDKLEQRQQQSLVTNPTSMFQDQGLRNRFRELWRGIAPPAVSVAQAELFPSGGVPNVPAGWPVPLPPSVSMAQ